MEAMWHDYTTALPARIRALAARVPAARGSAGLIRLGDLPNIPELYELHYATHDRRPSTPSTDGLRRYYRL